MGLRIDNLIAERRMQSQILVYPDGRIGGSTYYQIGMGQHPVGTVGSSYVIDVVRDVDRRVRRDAERDDRVIAGSRPADGQTPTSRCIT